MNTVTVTASNGKTYVVAAPRAYRTVGGKIIVAYQYWTTRNGKPFGPQRVASLELGGNGIGVELATVGRQQFGVDHAAMIAAVAAK